MKKVLIDSRPLFDHQPTGVGTYTRNFLVNLAAGRPTWEVTLWSTGRSNARPGYLAALPFKKWHVQLPNRWLNAAWLLNGPPYFQSDFKQFDYLVLPNLNYLPKLPIKYALIVHDLSFIERPNFYSLKSRLWHAGLHYKRLISAADKIITVSETTRQRLLHFFPQLLPARVKTIYPGLTLDQLPPDQAVKLLAEYNLPKQFVLYLGTAEERKNLASVLAAFAEVKQTRPGLSLVVAGRLGFLSRSVKGRLRAPGVLYMNYVSAALKTLLLQRAELLLWPSFYEGFCFPPLEALAYGTPVVVSHRTSLPEVLEERATYVNPHNYGELAAVLKQLLKKPLQRRPDLSLLETYDWQRSVQAVIDFIDL